MKKRQCTLAAKTGLVIAAMVALQACRTGDVPARKDAATSQPTEVEGILRRVEEKFLEGYNNHDVEAVKSVVHMPGQGVDAESQLTDVGLMIPRLERRKKSSDGVVFSLVSFKFMGGREDTALARVGLHKKGRHADTGKEVDVRIDAIHVFRHVGDEWKLWADFAL